MRSLSSEWNFLVLGHRGFIGSEILSFLRVEEIEVLSIAERIDVTNAQSLLKNVISAETVVINCIASGVTPGTGNYDENYQTNFHLVQQLCDASLSFGAHGFIHFASNYELPRHIRPLASRTPYVETKSKGSGYCLQQIELGQSVKLAYLPTVMGLNQPHGRFFRDFVAHLQQQIPFQIKYPGAEIEIITVSSMMEQLDFSNPTIKWGVQEVIENLRVLVLEFATILNSILNELGEESLELVDNNMLKLSTGGYNLDLIQPEVREYFANQLTLALRGSNE